MVTREILRLPALFLSKREFSTSRPDRLNSEVTLFLVSRPTEVKYLFRIIWRQL